MFPAEAFPMEEADIADEVFPCGLVGLRPENRRFLKRRFGKWARDMLKDAFLTCIQNSNYIFIRKFSGVFRIGRRV